MSVETQLAPVSRRKPVSKPVLLFLTLVFGWIGVHKFYLGRFVQGLLYLLFAWFWMIPLAIALVEFIVYALASPARLEEKYSAHPLPAAVATLVGVLFYGTLAAIVIPVYIDMTVRNQVAMGHRSARAWQQAVEDYYADKRQWPKGKADLREGNTLSDSDRWSRASLGPNGVITVTMSDNSRIKGATMVLRPEPAATGSLRWDCTGGTIKPRHRIGACRSK